MRAKTILNVIGVNHDWADLLAAAELAQRSDLHLKAIIITWVSPPIADLVGQAYSTYALAWEEENARANDRATRLAARR